MGNQISNEPEMSSTILPTINTEPHTDIIQTVKDKFDHNYEFDDDEHTTYESTNRSVSDANFRNSKIIVKNPKLTITKTKIQRPEFECCASKRAYPNVHWYATSREKYCCRGKE